MYNDVFKKLLDRGDFIGIEGETFKNASWRALGEGDRP